MTTLIFSTLIILLAMGGLALGVMFGRAPVKGSCGGLACHGLECTGCRQKEDAP